MHSSTIAFLDGLGGPEVIVIAVVALLLFGSKRMPEIGRGVGRAIREFKRATSGVEENIREVLYEEPAHPKLRPPAQRRPHRDATAHASVESATSATPASAPASTPHAAVDLHEAPPPGSDAAKSDDSATRAEDSPHRDDSGSGRS